MKKTLTLMIVFMALLGQGCAKEATQLKVPNNGYGPGVGGYPGNGPAPLPPRGSYSSPTQRWNEGATAKFYPINNHIMSDYVAQRPVNNPTDVKVNVSLFKNHKDGSYGGSVRIGYYDNGQWHEGHFTSGSGIEPVHKREVTMYNKWFFYPPAGGDVFHGFFSDQLGAIVLVIDDGVDLGDGQGLTTVSGSVWFKNFGVTTAPQSPTKCWFVKPPKGVKSTPYDCRTFIKDGKVVTASALYPSTADGYQELGRFYDLDKPAAFNE